MPYDHKIFDLYDYQCYFPLSNIPSTYDYINTNKHLSDPDNPILKKNIINILAYEGILLYRNYGGIFSIASNISSRLRRIISCIQKNNENDMNQINISSIIDK